MEKKDLMGNFRSDVVQWSIKRLQAHAFGLGKQVGVLSGKSR